MTTTITEKLKKKADEGLETIRYMVHSKVGESRTLCPITSPYHQDLGTRAKLLLADVDQLEDAFEEFMKVKTAPPDESRQGELPVDEPAGDRQFGDGRVELPPDKSPAEVAAEKVKGRQLDAAVVELARLGVGRGITVEHSEGKLLFVQEGADPEEARVEPEVAFEVLGELEDGAGVGAAWEALCKADPSNDSDIIDVPFEELKPGEQAPLALPATTVEQVEPEDKETVKAELKRVIGYLPETLSVDTAGVWMTGNEPGPVLLAASVTALEVLKQLPDGVGLPTVLLSLQAGTPKGQPGRPAGEAPKKGRKKKPPPWLERCPQGPQKAIEFELERIGLSEPTFSISDDLMTCALALGDEVLSLPTGAVLHGLMRRSDDDGDGAWIALRVMHTESSARRWDDRQERWIKPRRKKAVA